MSGFIAGAGEDYLLRLMIGATDPLSDYYIALINHQPPTRFISGDVLDEPSSEDYARAIVPNIAGNWSEPSGEVSNLYPVEFSPAEGYWGVLRHYAICDSEEGGEVLWAGDFEVPITVDEGDQVVLHPGTLVLRATSYRSRVEM